MAKKAAPKAAAAKASSAKAGGSQPKSITKGEVFAALSEKSGLTKKQVASVFDELGEMIGRELGKKGPGQFVVPGLIKLKVVRKPATKEKPGINPFTKQPMTIKAKPACNVVRALPLKALKELV